MYLRNTCFMRAHHRYVYIQLHALHKQHLALGLAYEGTRGILILCGRSCQSLGTRPPNHQSSHDGEVLQVEALPEPTRHANGPRHAKLHAHMKLPQNGTIAQTKCEP